MGRLLAFGSIMQRMKIARFVALALSISVARSTYAWSPSGHEAASMIAYDQLTADARAKVNAILEAHPRRDKDLLAALQTGDDRNATMFVVASTWPDMVRLPTNPFSHTDNHPVWHYVDYPVTFEPDAPAGPQPVETWDGKSDPQNLLQAMQKLTPEFMDNKTTTTRQAIDLSWIEHLVEDIHQPLHAADMYSKLYPQGDRGGNLEMVLGADGRIITLHGYWDSLEGPDTGYAIIRKTADRIEKEHPVSEFGKAITHLDPMDWAKESLELAKTDVYLGGKLETMPRNLVAQGAKPALLPIAYENRAHALAEERLALAGYRLAALVEKMVANMPVPVVNTTPMGVVAPAETPAGATTQP
jgi:hypothetical protein